MQAFNVGFEGLSVEVLHLGENIFAEAWGMFRETWLSLHDKEYDPQDSECQQAILDILTNRALPIPKENWKVQVRITGISRVALAQITRGRIGHNYVVQSQMPQHIDHNVTVPFNIATDGRFAARIANLIADSQALYDDMYEAGIPPQDCRYMTMHGQTTSLVWTTNYAALCGFFMLRAENGLTDELNMVCRLLKRSMKLYAEEKPECSDWLQLLPNLDCLGARQQKCMIADRVFGNTGRFKSAGDYVAEPGTCDYDFRKSAWYDELIRMPEDLLFPGEAEMIARWKAGGPLVTDC